MPAIDPLQDELLGLSEVSAMLPTLNGKKIHTATLSRWITKGVRGVRLDAIRIGKSFATTRDAVRAFLNTLNGIDMPESTAAKIDTAAHERAMRKLRQAGF